MAETVEDGAPITRHLTLHAQRAIYPMQQQALAWDREDFMSIKLPRRDSGSSAETDS
jgi:hypothetical protein